MDKYTIDLDKVLNDFEYSELTEESNGYNSVSSNNIASQPAYNYTDKNYKTETLPNAQAYPKVPSTTTKHSINNVFHSLNEYLNSDIKDFSNPELSEINEIETRIPTYVSKPQTSIQDIFKGVSSEIKSVDDKDSVESSIIEDNEDIQRSVESNTTLSYVNSKTTVLPSLLKTDSKQSLIDCDSFYINEVNQSHVSKNDSLNLIDNDISIYNNETEYSEGNNCSNPLFMNTNTTTSLSDVKSNHTFIDSNLKTSSESYQCIMSQKETKNDKNTECQKEIDKNIRDNPISDVDFGSAKNKIEVPVSLKNDISSKICKTSDNLISEVNIYGGDNIKVEEILPDETYSDTEESNQLPTNITFPQTLQNDNLNTEQTDITNLITESSKILLKQEIKNDLTKNTNLTLNNISITEKLNEEVDLPKSNIEKYDYQISKMSSVITDIKVKVGFEQDFDISDTEIENELEKLEEEYKEIENDGNYETENFVNDNLDLKNEIVVKEVEEINENIDVNSENVNIVNNIDSLEELKDDSSGIGESPNEINMKETQSDVNSTTNRENYSLLRPNSLDINPETPENSPINLIGNPGSTPFNNIYVENSIESESHTPSKKPEGEHNNSLSPTMSEVSTSEASDSPNTSDSYNDTSLDDNLNDSKNDPDKNNTNTENVEDTQNASGDAKSSVAVNMLGKIAPFWTPDSEAINCLHCNLKFTVVKRRHHCRACGLVLCSKCCYMKIKLLYMDKQEARVCTKCYKILTEGEEATESDIASPSGAVRPLNPANPMEYCSVIPPLQQVQNLPTAPPSVMVPVGVLKRKGSGKSKSAKSVMFCDGIRPGCDLTELDHDFNYKPSQATSKSTTQHVPKQNRNLPKLDIKTNSYIPTEENSLPPTVNVLKAEITYTECANNQNVVEMLKNEKLTFALQRNLHIHVKIINMDCCINKQAWCFTTEGMITVGQDEIIILLEFVDNEKTVPKNVFLHLNHIYSEAVKGTSITEMGLSIHNNSNFLESKNHAGFLYIKPTFQCIQNVIIPKEPYLIGILIHRWETPWAKIFPLRLLLRLGAEYRYYPSPIISTRHRESVYVEIGHTIINLLADFRNFSYTLPNVRGLTIHMKEKNTTVSIPQNRYDQVMKALNNSSDHILAFSANFSPNADSHLVCIQDTHGNNENAYTTHAINIHNKPRKVTGASFIVLNGALKSSSGLTAKSSIVEDGLMIQILPEQMVKLRNSLRNMKDFKINCGCVNAQCDEFVNIIWTENDVNFNVGVVSPIDNLALSGVPSIRVHNGKDFVCNSGNKMIRWTEVFIIQSGDENTRTQDPVDISKLSENISKATCQALVKYLDLLATNSFMKIGIRTNLHVENVSYLAGSNGVKLPPIYMKSLDNELIPILHKITSNSLGENAIVIELIFHILNM